MLLFLLQDAKPAWYADPMVVATVVVAIATVVNVIATLLLWLTTKRSADITREIFEAAHRPYMGTTVIDMLKHDEPAHIHFVVKCKNFGTVPARDLKLDVRVAVDGHLLPGSEMEEEPFAVMPPGLDGQTVTVIDDPREYKLVVSASVLTLTFECSYKGVGQKQYSYKEKCVYDKKRDIFSVIKSEAT